MKDQYDFSKGQRGKFYRPEAVFRLPVYLDEQVETYLTAKADAKGVDRAVSPAPTFNGGSLS